MVAVDLVVEALAAVAAEAGKHINVNIKSVRVFLCGIWYDRGREVPL